jgi:la-related protein 1
LQNEYSGALATPTILTLKSLYLQDDTSDIAGSSVVPSVEAGLLPPNGLSDPLAAETIFYDNEVANLTLVFNNPKVKDEDRPAQVPFHNSSSRTFSNGSINRRSIGEEMHEDSRQGRAPTNGIRGPDS